MARTCCRSASTSSAATDRPCGPGPAGPSPLRGRTPSRSWPRPSTTRSPGGTARTFTSSPWPDAGVWAAAAAAVVSRVRSGIDIASDALLAALPPPGPATDTDPLSLLDTLASRGTDPITLETTP